MASHRIGQITLAIGAVLLLAGCEEGKPGLFGPKADDAVTAEGEASVDGAEAAKPARSVRLVERDTEAPDVFQLSDKGLWDGRPSLGGVWVAHPTVKDPERVIIRNPANGKFVIGALFRREIQNPGPALQISSDAAAALGLLAGQPADLNVVALRREEVPTAGAAVATTDEAAAEAVTATPETIEAAPVAEAAASPDAAPDAVPETAPAEPPRKLTRKERREAARAAKAAAAAAASGVVTDVVTSETLPPAPGASAQAAGAPAPAPAAAAPSSSLSKPYLQIGIFSVEANAEKAGDQLRKVGVIPTIKKETSQGKDFWRVIVGPAGNAADQAAILKKVKGLGYQDAYAVSR
jgi:hypothetical protein